MTSDRTLWACALGGFAGYIVAHVLLPALTFTAGNF